MKKGKFMCVELFNKLFDRYNGQQLPPVAAIERAIENLGVAPKQKDKVRQVFLRSAKQAGLFELATDRMSTPPGLNPQNTDLTKTSNGDGKKEEGNKSKTGGSNGDRLDLPPFIQGLINKLPAPESKWDLAGRAKWLTTAANIFDLMYLDEDDKGLSVTLEGKTLSIKVGADK